MAREYQKTVWQNEPNTATPLDADNLNHIEDGIYNLETKVENKVDKVNGKGLSTNDFTDEKNNKLAGIETGAQANVQSDFSQNDSSADDYIKNKPNMANYATKTYVDNSFTIAGKKSGTTLGTNATAEGTNNTVTGGYGHGEGNDNTASGYAAHAENYETTASGFFSHSQGYGTIANGESQHVAGKFNVADNNNAYAEIIGGGSSDDSRANIRTLDWNGNAKYSGNVYAQNNKILAKAEDVYTKSEVDAKVSSAYHPAGTKTVAQLTSSLLVAANIGNVYNITDSGTTTADFYEGSGKPIRRGDNVGICNFGTDSSPFILFDLLSGFVDTSEFATNSAVNTALSGKVDKVNGKGLSTNDYTTAEKEKLANINLTNYATKDYVDESYTIAGKAENTTVGSYSTAEGHNNTATGNHVHVEGYGNTATGAGNHAEGYGNTISGQYGHVEGTENTVSGYRTHVEGTGNIGSGYAQHVSGKYNVADNNSTYAEIVGGGEDSTHRANIRTLDWDGTGRYAGDLYVHDSRKVLDTKDKKEVASTFKDKYDESSIPSTYTTKYYSIGYPSIMYPAADYGSATTCCINVKNGNWYSYTDTPDDAWVLEDELPLRGGGTADNLTDLGDVNINSPLGGQVLVYNNSQQKWSNGNLPTVTITPTIQSGTKIADYSIDGTSGSLYAPQVSDINDLSDVDLNNLSNGQILKYNSTTQKWENSEESGSARPYFENYYPMSKVGEVNTLKFRYNNTLYIAKHVCYIDSQDKYMIIDRQGGIWITDVLDDVTYYSNISSNVTFEKFKWLTNDNVIGYATDGYIYYASAANALGGYFTQTTEIGTNLDFINFYEDDGVINCITNTGVWESSDYGVTWTQIKTGTYTNSLSGDGMIAYTTSTKIYIKNGTDFVEYALPITSGNTVYGNGLFVCYTDGVIYTSTDSCNTWVRKYLFIDETGGTWYTVNALSDDLLITYTHGAFGICNDSQWALSYDFNFILSLSTYTDESSLDKWFDDGNNEYVYSTYGNSVYYAPYKTVKNIGIGKGLSTEDYTTEEKTKLAGIETQANKTVVDSSMSTTSENPLQNKVITAELAGTKTTQGNPITVNDASPVNAVDVSVDLEPVQDLHGYDHPWVGGAGKNKLPMTVSTIKANNTSGTWSGNIYSVNAGTITILTDSDNNVIGIKVNGQFNANTFFYLGSYDGDSSKQYILNGCPSGGSVSGYCIGWQYHGYDTGGGLTTSGSSTIRNVNIEINDTSTSYNLIFYPMIRLSTETDPTFESYSNICPISGRSEVEIDRVGKNLFDKSTILEGYRIGAGGNAVAESGTWMSDYIYVKALIGKSIVANVDSTIAFYSKDKSFIERTNLYTVGKIIPQNAYYLRAQNTDAELNTYQIELGNQPTTYEPYKGKTYTIQFGQTVYGGELDVVTGELRVTHKSIDLNTINSWMYSPTYKVFYQSIDDSKYSGVGIQTGYKCYCSGYKSTTISWLEFDNNNISVGADTKGNTRPCIAIKDTRYTDAESFKTAVSGVQLVYELATPYTIDLTPQQIKLLENTNTVYTDYEGDTITIEYQPNNAIGEAVRAVEESYDSIIQNLLERIEALENNE